MPFFNIFWKLFFADEVVINPSGWIVGIKICIIDDATDRRLAADLAFYPPVPQVARLDWSGSSCAVYSGWEWVILRSLFSNLSERKPNLKLQLLISMGGSDPLNFTSTSIAGLDRLDIDVQVTVIIGPGFANKAAVAKTAARSRHQILVLENPANIAGIMVDADFALTAFGMTAYELAVCGVPALYFCLSADHAVSAEAFTRAGVGVSLGYRGDISTDDVTEQVQVLLSDRPMLSVMGHNARSLIDGAGARRIADIILGRC